MCQFKRQQDGQFVLVISGVFEQEDVSAEAFDDILLFGHVGPCLFECLFAFVIAGLVEGEADFRCDPLEVLVEHAEPALDAVFAVLVKKLPAEENFVFVLSQGQRFVPVLVEVETQCRHVGSGHLHCVLTFAVGNPHRLVFLALEDVIRRSIQHGSAFSVDRYLAFGRCL